MSQPVPEKASHRIKEFEGLRGCLAWWVVLFHLGLLAQIPEGALTKVEGMVALGGWQAVELFIILSGFVIALLLDVEKESYTVFITRRFFRLVPVYYVLLLYGIVLAVRQGLYGDQLRQHILAHLTLLHGLVPDEILKGSANAFCHPAWSISVEWQFYLIAPFCLWLARKSAAAALGLLAVCTALWALLVRLGTFPFQATVFMRPGLFGVGIASYYLYRSAMEQGELTRRFVAYLLPAGGALLLLFAADPITVPGLWIILFLTVLARHAGVESWPVRLGCGFLSLPFVVWLGRLSYSTYLCHVFVLGPVVGVAKEPLAWLGLGVRGRLVALAVLAGVPILAVSAVLHYLVEKPGMQFGRQVSALLARRPAPAVPVAAAVPEPAVAVVEAYTPPSA
jgi:peptidoglycan/LPS O-acetylase OafA/YrhL